MLGGCFFINTMIPKEKINLEILRKFYIDVWAKYTPYVENDRALYFIFNHKNDAIFSNRVRGFILNEMYSAFVHDTHLNEVINDYCNFHTSEDVNKEILNLKEQVKLNKSKNEKIEIDRNYPSFLSKFSHWRFEANQLWKDACPIYDNHVRKALKCGNSYENVKAGIEKFIKEKLKINNLSEPITLKIDGLHEEISIYRLVDKFLWLSGKIMKYQKDKENGKLKQQDKLLDALITDHYNDFEKEILKT